MISEILRRSFVLAWLDDVETTLADLARETGDEEGDYAAALERIRVVRDAGLPGQPGDSGDSADQQRRSAWEEEHSLDEESFFSRDALVSLLQSALEERIEAESPSLIIDDDPDDRRRAWSDLPATTSRRLDIDASEGRRLGGRFEITDLRWIADFGVAKALRAFRDRHPFNPEPAGPVELAPRARLIFVGDWGSGLPRAQRIGELMRERIEAGLDDDRQVHVVHLGDVYYSGFGWEYNKRFLPWWPVLPEEAGTIFSWSLNGNHDMYSGGHGYFQTLLADPRFANQ